MTPASYIRGETIVIAFEAVDASDEQIAAVEMMVANLKRTYGTGMPADTVPVAAVFAVTPRPASDGVSPGWWLTLSAAQSATLEPGTYVTNASLAFAGGVIEKSDPLFIRIEQSTT